jgi:hypothetical protein
MSLDDLLVGDGQAFRWTVRVDAYAEPLHQGTDLGPHRLPIDLAEATRRLPAHEDVLRYREVREQRRFLVDHGDASCLRFGGGLEIHRLALHQEGSRVALVEPSDDLDQRGLAGAVLSYQGVDRVWIERQASRAQRDDLTECFRNVTELEGWNLLTSRLRHLPWVPSAIETLQ